MKRKLATAGTLTEAPSDAQGRNKKKFLTIPEAVEETGCTQKAIRQKIFRNQIPYLRWGRRIFISSAELDKFLAALPGTTAEEALAKAEEVSR